MVMRVKHSEVYLNFKLLLCVKYMEVIDFRVDPEIKVG